MPKYGYLVVEGPHDIEFACRILASYRLSRVQHESALDDYFQKLVPRAFPFDGDLLRRVPVPLFVRNETHLIAIHSAIGDSRIAAMIEENAAIIDFERLTGVGLILDSDELLPTTRYAAIKNNLQTKGYTLADSPGTVTAAKPRMGAYILPDNNAQGCLEDILLECAQQSYPELRASAERHIRDAGEIQNLDCESLEKRSIKNKAIVSTISAVLRPGKAVQVSIQDNKWLRDKNLLLKRIKDVQSFFESLFELS